MRTATESLQRTLEKRNETLIDQVEKAVHEAADSGNFSVRLKLGISRDSVHELKRHLTMHGYVVEVTGLSLHTYDVSIYWG